MNARTSPAQGFVLRLAAAQKLAPAMIRRGWGRVINIASLATFAASWLAPRMVAFVRAHPDISFNITAYHHGLADIEDRNIDVAIYFGEPSWPGTVVAAASSSDANAAS